MKSKLIGRILLATGLVLVTALAASAIYVAAGIRYPAPAGPYEVGRTRIFVTDESRDETFSDDPGDRRELPVTVYYPASDTSSEPLATFASDAVCEKIAGFNGTPSFLLKTIISNSHVDASVSDKGPFPVLLFSGGLYGQLPFYGSLLERLASEGFVIVAVEHPYSDVAVEMSDGRIVTCNDPGTAYPELSGEDMAAVKRYEALGDVWVRDMNCVLSHVAGMNETDERFAGSMDLARVGIFGHSFGGAAAVAAARENPEILAAVNMDGTMFGSMADPLTQPVMLMMNEQGISQSALYFREKVEISETSEACYHLLLRGSTHDSFATDSGLIYDKYSILRSPEVASIGGFEALDSLTAYLKAFFDQYLSGVDSDLLNQAVTPEYIQVFCVRYGYEIPDSAEVSHEE